MTPKEKAKEFADKIFAAIESEYSGYYNTSKYIAIIMVEEIIKILPSVYLTNDEEIHSGHRQYWDEVKKELEDMKL